MPTQKKSVGFI
jgi:hypothetical protein